MHAVNNDLAAVNVRISLVWDLENRDNTYIILTETPSCMIYFIPSRNKYKLSLLKKTNNDFSALSNVCDC